MQIKSSYIDLCLQTAINNTYLHLQSKSKFNHFSIKEKMTDYSKELQGKKVLVTGVTGLIGKATVEHLLKKGIPANQIIGLSRKKEPMEDLAARGIEVRFGDYFDYDSLVRAFEGIDKIMLTSTVAFTDRSTQHYNAITAARQAGVKHVVYMAIMRKEGSQRIMPEVTESDLYTEQVLKSSGLTYTIVYHPPFTDALSFFLDPNSYENGIKVPANNGKMAPATRDELAEAHAEILSTPGHENKTYSLGGSNLISFADIAKILAEVKGQPVPFTTITSEEYIDGIVAKGAPRHVAEFITSWVLAIEGNEFEHQSGDLERLLGRKTKTFREYVESTLA
ncbi:SDR family oxidoreductase [Mucilaginibacter sp. Bleaf8]|uniref:SDR family oxidoreductase n=1 Tax=Mucilaginibacter sp. Bleaf8 TaxID=2834430 RepID=UPI001BCF20E6|nr:SDR family oxidoreductase [Mucilaginibacter sp. Bleaf8]MBS7564720.1 SDR family oxidoreductase [Mucilaginibacter sp. Bleaf8]